MRKSHRIKLDHNHSGAILPSRFGHSGTGLSRGQSSVEFAMVGLLFFALVVAVMNYSWIFFAKMTVQQAMDDGGRFASTGNHLTTKPAPRNRARSQSST